MARPMTLQRVQHVSLPRPRGAANDEKTRDFYERILGLTEVPAPAALAASNLIWYRLGDNELHLFPSDRPPAHAEQHLCIQVDDVEALRAHLAEAGVEIIEDIPVPNRPRLFCRDPFDNLIEFTAILGPYSTA